MYITRKALSRRTLLKGAGASIALPFLSAMVPAATANALGALTPTRLGFHYIPHGSIIANWRPTSEHGSALTAANLPKDLGPLGGSQTQVLLNGQVQPLQFGDFREHMTVVSGLQNSRASGGTPHGVHSGTWLTATRPLRNISVYPDRISVDQRYVELFGQNTPFPSLEIGTDGNGPNDPSYGWGFGKTLAHSRSHPLQLSNNPRILFAQMFGHGDTPEQRARLQAEKVSVLDGISDQAQSLQRQLGTSDQAIVADFLDAIREVERRIELAAATDTSMLEIPNKPVGIPLHFPDHMAILFDLEALALQANLTNVVTNMMNAEVSMRVFNYAPVSDSAAWHPMSHNGGASAARSNVVMLHTALFAQFIQRLADTPDGDGTLLDHSLMVYGSNMGNGSAHNFADLPTVLVGRANGAIRGNQHLIYDGQELNSLWLTLLDRLNVPVDRLGDSTSRFSEV